MLGENHWNKAIWDNFLAEINARESIVVKISLHMISLSLFLLLHREYHINGLEQRKKKDKFKKISTPQCS